PQTCQPDEFTCANKRACISISWRCDGEHDCPDKSDEIGCHGNVTQNCTSSQHQCDNGQCILKNWICDGESDCSDGSDEKRCDKPKGTTFRTSASANTVSAGSTVNFMCQARGYPKPEYKFYIKTRGNVERQLNYRDAERSGKISNLGILDSSWHGTYICIPHNRLGDGPRKEVILYVRYPPVINRTVSSQRVAAWLGYTATLICFADGNPEPKYKWTNARGLVSESEEDGILKITPTDDTPQTCQPDEFTCANKRACISISWRCDGEHDCPDKSDEIGCHGNVTQNCTSSQHQCDNGQCILKNWICDGESDCSDGSDEKRCDKPKGTTFRTSASANTVSAGSTVNFMCQARGYPKPEYKFYIKTRGNVERQLNYRDAERSGKISNLGILDSSWHGTYICIPHNRLGDGPRKEVILYVRYPPKIIRPPRHVVVSENDFVGVQCLADGYPKPTITWIKLTGNEVKSYGSSFYIPSVTRKDQGEYQCVADNKFGKPAVHRFVIDVKYPPKIIREPRHVVVSENDFVGVQCLADGYPKPTITWIKLTGNEVKSYGSSFNIPSVTRKDQGEYQCVADNKFGKPAVHRFVIDVKYPPKIIRPPRHVVVSENDFVGVQCLADGYPKPTITWIKLTGNEVKSYGSSFNIPSVTRKDQGEYQCVADNKFGKPAVHRFVIDVKYPPKIIRPPRHVVVSENDFVGVQCLADGYPKPTITWIKLTGNEVKSYGSSFNIPSVTRKDQGEYQCVADNKFGKPAVHRFVIDVKYPPKIIREPRHVVVIENDFVSVQCLADGYPKPTITWIKLTGNEVKSYGSSFNIPSVTRKDQGEYQCVADNKFGKPAVHRFVIDVKYPPVINRTVSSQRVAAWLGYTATLICFADGNPEPKYKWTNARGLVSESEEDGILKITPTDDSAFGDYTCQATNSRGMDTHMVTLIKVAPQTCQPGEFTCANKRACISISWRCDGEHDCPDKSDEIGCHGNVTQNCTLSQHQCDNGQCILMKWVCDGDTDCSDGSDEKRCGNATQKCTSSQHQCDNGQCIHKSWVCDGESNCNDGSDEKGCWSKPFLIFTDRHSIRQLSLNSSEFTRIVSRQRSAIALDYDYETSTVYWADAITKNIKTAPMNNGSAQTVLVRDSLHTPEGLSVDWVNKKMYWTDRGTDVIEVADLDGKNRLTLINSGLDNPRAIVVYPDIGLMFWSDWGESPKIERCGMNGDPNTRLAVITTNIQWPNALTVDYTIDKIIWADAKVHTIESANLDGSHRRVILSENIHHPFAITVFHSKMYWTDWEKGSVYVANRFTGKDINVIRDGLQLPMDIHVYHQQKQLKKGLLQFVTYENIVQCRDILNVGKLHCINCTH
ncbi:hypothetical protein QZH41_017585, partial [Actinostola sp. cb2023]